MEGLGEYLKMIIGYVMAIGVTITIIFALGFFLGKYIGYNDGITKCNNETIMKQLQK